jgi:hypothetical protein
LHACKLYIKLYISLKSSKHGRYQQQQVLILVFKDSTFEIQKSRKEEKRISATDRWLQTVVAVIVVVGTVVMVLVVTSYDTSCTNACSVVTL